MKHSIRSISDAAGVSTVGNVAYLSNRPLQPSQLGKLAKWLPKEAWVKEALGRMASSDLSNCGWRAGWLTLEGLLQSMKVKNRIGYTDPSSPFQNIMPESEPDWLKLLPRDAQRYIRNSFAVTEGIDPLAIILQFPYMGFGYIIPDDGMAADAAQVFNLHRLNQVKQLSFLHDPVGKATDRSIASSMFEHTRYCHSMDVHAIANLVAHNIGLEGVQMNTLNTAAETHDALTPAGGDSVKLVDLQAFDEDLHYPELMVGNRWEEYQQKYQIDPALLVETIGGNGLLGRILDISDKSSYLARDTQAYLGTKNPPKQFVDTAYSAIASIINEDPFVCAVWENTREHKGSLVFNDPDRMARFLTLRALMFRELYYNPYSRFFEYLVGKGVVKYLYTKKLVTREDLLREGDWWIERKIDETLGTQSVLRKFHNLQNARIEEHLDHAMAMKRLIEFDDDEAVIVILDDFNPSTSPSTKKFMVRSRGNVSTFHDACPDAAGEIERIMKFPKIVRLYFFIADDLEIPRGSRKKIKEIIRSVM